MINEKAKKLWEEFADVPVDSNDRIEEEFLAFAEGTPREDIWHWFEDEFDLSVAEDLMGLGDGKQSDAIGIEDSCVPESSDSVTDTDTDILKTKSFRDQRRSLQTQESGANEIKFEKLGVKERELLFEALGISTENLQCQYCGDPVDYKTCSILPTQSNDKNTIIACGSPVCISEYLEDEEDKRSISVSNQWQREVKNNGN